MIELALAPTTRFVSIETDDERIERYVSLVYARLVAEHAGHAAADHAVLHTAFRPARSTFCGEPLPAPDPNDPGSPWNSGAYVADQFVWRALARDPAWLALHASALSIDGRGVLLVGPGGGGKTTLLLALAAAGAYAYGDEMALIHHAQRRTSALARRLAVRERSLDVLRDARLTACARASQPTGSPEGVYYLDTCELFAQSAAGADPLRAVFVLDGRGDVPGARPISRGAAALRIAPYVAGARRSLEQIAHIADLLADASTFILRCSDPHATAALVSRTVMAC